MKNTQIVMAAFENLIDGYPLPSRDSLAFAELILAIGGIDDANLGDDFHGIGTRALSLLLDRLKLSAAAERTLRIMRDNSQPTC
jgi:hypothetical protein